MPTLWKRPYSKRELLEHVGDVRQVGGLRRVRAVEGVEEGLEIVQVSTGELEFEVLPSRGLDLGPARFRGRSLTWLSAAGFSHPGLSEEKGVLGWLRAFGGGLLTTCGLSNVGRPGVDQGVEYGQHGRASLTPAFEVAAWGEWQGEEYLLSVRGKTREAVLYGDRLEKTRTVRAWLGQNRLEVTDRVENLGAKPAALLLLYHVNLGWPLVQAGTEVRAPSTALEVIEGTAEGWNALSGPDAEWRSAVLEHRMQPDTDGWVRIGVLGGGMRLELAYEAASLPRFTQWRQLGSGDYVMGLEPGNVGVRGRAWERANRTLPFLEPGESREFRLQISVESA